MNLFKNHLKITYFLTIPSFLVFLAIIYGILSNNSLLIYLDQKAQSYIDPLQTPELNLLMLTLTQVTNNYVFLLLSLITVGILFYKNRSNNAIWLIISLIIGLLMELSIKYIIARSRPPSTIIEISSYSFPSGHATIFVIFFLILYLSFRSLTKGHISALFLKWGSLLAVISILFSRLYLNAHWLSDIIGGVLLALFIVNSVYLVFRSNNIKIVT